MADEISGIGVTLKHVARSHGLNLALGLAAISTGALIAFDDELFTNTVAIAGAEAKDYQAVQYGDEATGGTSTARAIPGETMSWVCTLRRSGQASPYCGVGFALNSGRIDKGLDLSHFQTLRLELTYSGPSHLIRVYLKNFNSSYSRPGEPIRDKFNYTDTNIKDGHQTLTLNLDSFAVAEWWKAMMNLPVERAGRELSDVVGLEIQTGTDAAAGRYEIRIDRVAFEQRKIAKTQLYAGIAAFWALVFGMLIIRRRQIRLRIQVREATKHKWASEHDELTGLPNRRLFQASLAEAIRGANRQGGKAGLLLLDLDHFKNVNDTLGHQAGDELLKIVADRLRTSVREGDIVARIGGDEFAIILADMHDQNELIRVGDQVLQRMLIPLRVAEQLVSPGGSIGGALSPDHGATADELFKAADTALYALKESGRGGTKLFHSRMLARAEAVAAQLGQARAAVNEQSIIAHYQPKVDLKTGKRVGFEALLRCSNQDGIHMPSTLERAFEDYDLAAKMADQVQRTVARDVASWTEQGLDPGCVSINASPAEFLRDDYAQRLLRVLEEEGVSPSQIEVEVTEHVFFDRSAHQVSRAVELLRKHGVRISLDDFGTGYSSLSHLRDIRVDCVKIDRSFVDKLHGDRELAAIVSAIIAMSNTLGMDAVAEGIETQAQADMLRAMGCGFGQGYLYGKPISATDVEQLLASSIPKRHLRAV